MATTHHSTITLDEALDVFRSAGYLVEPTKSDMTTKPWTLSEPIGPDSYDTDWISEHDLLMQAIAVRDHILCAFCGQPAESHCPDCGVWTCYEDRRDFPPHFDEHLCGPCVQRRNAQVAHALQP